MTAQIQDKVKYQDDLFAIVGLKGESLPAPQDFGMTPIPISTTCYRGYYAGYALINEHLCLTSLTLKEQTNTYTPIDNQAGQWDTNTSSRSYHGLSLPTTFSGRLLLGRGFINSMYIHMGFQKPVAYQQVIELWLHHGQLIDYFDLSKKVAQQRKIYYQKHPMGIPHRSLNADDIAQWVTHMFSLEYNI